MFRIYRIYWFDEKSKKFWYSEWEIGDTKLKKQIEQLKKIYPDVEYKIQEK